MKERKSESATPNKAGGGEVAEDWDTFRHFVKIIQIVGELCVKDDHYEELLKKQVQTNFVHARSRSISSILDANSSSTSNSLPPHSSDAQLSLLSVFSFKEYLLEDAERLKLKTLISIIESGSFMIIPITLGLRTCHNMYPLMRYIKKYEKIGPN